MGNRNWLQTAQEKVLWLYQNTRKSSTATKLKVKTNVIQNWAAELKPLQQQVKEGRKNCLINAASKKDLQILAT